MSKRVFSIPALAALLLTLVGATQPRTDEPSRLRAALDRNDAAAAEQILREYAQTAPAEFTRNQYDYLLARLLERRGATAEAGSLFQKIATRNASLAGYAVWHEAAIARATGNLAEEQRLLQRFLAQQPDHLYRERALRRLAGSYSRTGQYQNVINTLRLVAGPRREAQAMIGEAQLALRQPQAARATFEAILVGGSMDDASLRACLGLDRIDEAAATPLTEAERLRRARVYQYNRYFAEARRHWAALIRFFPQSPKRAEALYTIGRGYFLENNFNEAMKWYARAHDEAPRSEEGEQGFYYVGHCHQFLDDANRAIAQYLAYLKEYPDGKYVGYAHLNAIDTLRSAGRPAEALEWAARAQGLAREPFIALSGLLQQARIHMSQENYSAALADFTALRGRNLNLRGQTAGTNAAEAAYFRAYCLERLGRWEQAINEYLALPELRAGSAGYYGLRASGRLLAMLNNPQARALVAARRDRFFEEARAANAQGNAAAAKTAANQALRLQTGKEARAELLAILRTAYSRLPGYKPPEMPVQTIGRGGAPTITPTHQALAGDLLSLGLYDEGGPELAAAGAALPTMAFYCSRGDCASRAVKYAEPLLNAMPEDYRLELLPRETAEIFFPYPYRDSLERHAGARSLDPRFVLSIARQETRYNPNEKSAAAARGMMQFIPSTANQIAAQLNLRDFEQDDLYEADTAILFGAQYMKNLLDEFASSQAVAAAYNGSEESVRRWRLRANSKEVDRLVLEIAKSQTKDYVFKVMNFYNAYRIIYPL